MKDPPIHVVSGDDKLRICLSRVAKWVAGVAATVTGALLIGAFAFAWRSNDMLGRIDEKLGSVEHRLDGFDRRIERLDDRLNMKADKR